MTTSNRDTTNLTDADKGSPHAIGWIGLGDQGAPMARAIAEAGFDLHVWVRRAASLDALGGVPYVRHETLAELGDASDAVGLCLRVDSDIEDVLDAGGLWQHLRPGTVLVNHGTGLPDVARALAAQGADTGVSVLDAPVSGGRPGAEARTLTTIVGGDPAGLERMKPVFESFSTTIAHMGGTGAGQIGKLINNALLMMNQQNVQLVLRLARPAGPRRQSADQPPARRHRVQLCPAIPGRSREHRECWTPLRAPSHRHGTVRRGSGLSRCVDPRHQRQGHPGCQGPA